MSQVRAGAAYVELLTKDSAFVKGLQLAQKRLNSFTSSAKLLGTKLMRLGAAAPQSAGSTDAAKLDAVGIVHIEKARRSKSDLR